MKNILVCGAGRSAYFTIEYLLANAQRKEWHVTVADSSQENLDRIKKEFYGVNTIFADVYDGYSRQNLIKGNDIVISLLPAGLHILIARACLDFGAHLITPSYISDDLKLLNNEAAGKKLTFLNEMGLDPGIDHMSSMSLIHELKYQGAVIKSYKSYCGGLISKDWVDNPWQYKISWNPNNIIRAGHDGGLCLLNKKFHYVPYSRLFRENEWVQIDGEGFESYYNRNSIPYIVKYGLQEADTFLRGTLRYPGFCKKWDILVKLGLTTDDVTIENKNELAWDDYLMGFLPESKKNDLSGFANNDIEIINAINWLIKDAGNIELNIATPAENLQKLLEKKWKLNAEDKDRVVMVHLIQYEKDNKLFELKSSLDMGGIDSSRTAMAKTVGLPLAIAAELIADEKIKAFGVILPTIKEVYEPMLAALQNEGIRFKEEIFKI